jgi:hypothetical protein
MSSAYRKPETCRQHRAALNGGMTYSNRARATTRRIRIRRIRVAGLLVVIAAIAASRGYQLLATSSSPPMMSISSTLSKGSTLSGG